MYIHIKKETLTTFLYFLYICRLWFVN